MQAVTGIFSSRADAKRPEERLRATPPGEGLKTGVTAFGLGEKPFRLWPGRADATMKAVTGIFSPRADAKRAEERLRATGVPADKVTLLTQDNIQKELESVPADATEQPGMGKAMGAVVGAAAGLTGGGLVMAALVPGVGPVSAAGLLGAAILGAAGGRIGGATGALLGDFYNTGLSRDGIIGFVDAPRQS